MDNGERSYRCCVARICENIPIFIGTALSIDR